MPKEKLLGKTILDIYPAEIANDTTNDDIEVFDGTGLS